MKRFDRYVSALQGTLQETPEVLHSVGVDLPVNIPFGMVDHLMHVVCVSVPRRTRSASVKILASFSTLARTAACRSFLPTLLTTLARTVLCPSGPCRCNKPITATLPIPPVPVMTRARLDLCMLRAFAADVGFVYLHMAAELAAGFVLHGKSDPVQHEPCRLLSDADGSGEFIAANAVLSRRNGHEATSHLSIPSGLSSIMNQSSQRTGGEDGSLLHCQIPARRGEIGPHRFRR